MSATSQETASFFFRYQRKGHPTRTYDVRISFDRQRMPAHIEIRHAGVPEDDLPPFSTGPLVNAPARRAVALLEFVGNVVARDRSRVEPGAVVYLAHLRKANRHATAPAAAPIVTAPARGRANVRRGTPLPSLQPRRASRRVAATPVVNAPSQARQRCRYPHRPL